MADHEFVAYIDESGDDGLEKYRTPGRNGGASHWLTLGACIVRRANDHSLIEARDQILRLIGLDRKREIHFKDLKHAQKSIVVDELRKLPVRLTTVLSCKSHIPNAKDTFSRKGQLYWYICRTLIERVSWCCAKHADTDRPLVQLVFSNRGGMQYQEFRDYVSRLRSIDTSINWNVISHEKEYIRSEAHQRFAGLQFADVSARAFSEAVEPNVYGYYEPSYAETLKPVVFQQKGNYTSYGVKPLAKLALLDEKQRMFFARYGKK